MNEPTKFTAIFTGLALLASCGGAEPAPDDGADAADPGDTTATAGGEDVLPSPPTPWAEMTFDDRKAWMANEVMPRLGPMFEEHDPERFAGFSCDGCHGADAQARNWEMPNPEIYTLYATGSQEQIEMVEEMRPMVNFMFRDVLPTMRTLLGAAEYDAETGEGFSCFYCHPNGGEGTPATDAEEAFLLRGRTAHGG